jgi:hypothetical protein
MRAVEPLLFTMAGPDPAIHRNEERRNPEELWMGS